MSGTNLDQLKEESVPEIHPSPAVVDESSSNPDLIPELDPHNNLGSDLLPYPQKGEVAPPNSQVSLPLDWPTQSFHESFPPVELADPYINNPSSQVPILSSAKVSTLGLRDAYDLDEILSIKSLEAAEKFSEEPLPYDSDEEGDIPIKPNEEEEGPNSNAVETTEDALPVAPVEEDSDEDITKEVLIPSPKQESISHIPTETYSDNDAVLDFDDDFIGAIEPEPFETVDFQVPIKDTKRESFDQTSSESDAEDKPSETPIETQEQMPSEVSPVNILEQSPVEEEAIEAQEQEPIKEFLIETPSENEASDELDESSIESFEQLPSDTPTEENPEQVPIEEITEEIVIEAPEQESVEEFPIMTISETEDLEESDETPIEVAPVVLEQISAEEVVEEQVIEAPLLESTKEVPSETPFDDNDVEELVETPIELPESETPLEVIAESVLIDEAVEQIVPEPLEQETTEPLPIEPLIESKTVEELDAPVEVQEQLPIEIITDVFEQIPVEENITETPVPETLEPVPIDIPIENITVEELEETPVESFEQIPVGVNPEGISELIPVEEVVKQVAIETSEQEIIKQLPIEPPSENVDLVEELVEVPVESPEHLPIEIAEVPEQKIIGQLPVETIQEVDEIEKIQLSDIETIEQPEIELPLEVITEPVLVNEAVEQIVPDPLEKETTEHLFAEPLIEFDTVEELAETPAKTQEMPIEITTDVLELIPVEEVIGEAPECEASEQLPIETLLENEVVEESVEAIPSEIPIEETLPQALVPEVVDQPPVEDKQLEPIEVVSIEPPMEKKPFEDLIEAHDETTEQLQIETPLEPAFIEVPVAVPIPEVPVLEEEAVEELPASEEGVIVEVSAVVSLPEVPVIQETPIVEPVELSPAVDEDPTAEPITEIPVIEEEAPESVPGEVPVLVSLEEPLVTGEKVIEEDPEPVLGEIPVVVSSEEPLVTEEKVIEEEVSVVEPIKETPDSSFEILDVVAENLTSDIPTENVTEAPAEKPNEDQIAPSNVVDGAVLPSFDPPSHPEAPPTPDSISELITPIDSKSSLQKPREISLQPSVSRLSLPSATATTTIDGQDPAADHLKTKPPSKVQGYMKIFKGVVQQSLGSLFRRRSLKARGKENKIDGKLEVDVARTSGNFQSRSSK